MLIFPFFDIKMPVNTIYFLKNLPLHCGFKKHRGTYIYWGSKIFPKFHAIRVRASPFFFFNLVSTLKLYIPSTIKNSSESCNFAVFGLIEPSGHY